MNNESDKNISTPLLRIVVGLIITGLIVKFTPILDLLQMFFMIVVVPVALAAAIGLVGSSTYNLFVDNTLGWVARLRVRAKEELDQIRLKQHEKEREAQAVAAT